MDASHTEAEYLDLARSYLQEALPNHVPDGLELVQVFEEQPLEGEGKTALLRFRLDLACSAEADIAGSEAEANAAPETGSGHLHYVAVGETEPNYFPAYGLEADQAYSLHLGTRFFLMMDVAKRSETDAPEGAEPALREFIRGVAPDAEISKIEVAAVFACEGQLLGVYRVTLNDELLYCFGIDAPPGFYRMTNLPAAVVLRLHLGQLIRSERDAFEADSERARH